MIGFGTEANGSLSPFIDALLAEQRELTVVEQFAQRYAATSGPALAEHYRELIPLSKPGPGEQYAFEVDLDECSGCKACVAACHNLNGLETDELWRQVGVLYGGSEAQPFIQHVTTACHHCVDPSCLSGCPVMAYEKDAITGIVRHLDDQCIGCQYCVFMCPFNVPRYSPSKGIVRKCDMCRDRLEVAEAPACVQACPNAAIRIRKVSVAAIAEQYETGQLLPTAPDPAMTLPTTIYKSLRPMPSNLLPADYFSATPQHSHLALVAMLVLTQLSVGAFVVGQAVVWMSSADPNMHIAFRPYFASAGAVLGLIGINAAVFHLGRPLFAYRALLGLRTSWLSREILAFGIFGALALLQAIAAWCAVYQKVSIRVADALGWITAAAGLVAVGCSIMIYVRTSRPFWQFHRTATKFLLTCLVLGLPVTMFTSLSASMGQADESAILIARRYVQSLCELLVVATLAKLIIESSVFAELWRRRLTPLKRTAILLSDHLSGLTLLRYFFGAAGGLLLPAVLIALRTDAEASASFHPLFLCSVITLAFAMLLIGELLERYLFFRGVGGSADAGSGALMSIDLDRTTPADFTAGDKAPSLGERVRAIVRQWDGPLTADLIRAPSKFGLGQVPLELAPDATTSMVCGFCSTGCGLNIHLRGGESVNLTPDVEYPVNLGMACPKGWEALNVLKSPDRATTPLVRNAGGDLVPIDSPDALQMFCDRFKKIQREHGPASVAFLSTGQLPTEEMVFLGSLAKFGMGMLHGDGNTRQCMATAVVAYKEAFGFDAPPYTYQDFEESDAIVLVGSNLCIAHPIMWQRVCRNRRMPEIIVVDPRKTETAMAATQHLAIKPKSDLTLLYGLAHILIAEGWIDETFIAAHTSGFDAFRDHVASFTPERVAEATGIAIESLRRAAQTIHKAGRTSFWWTMGVNQSYEGVRTAQAIINLALMTGNIGRPGTGANSITGQCNAMGSRLFSNTTGLLGGRDFTNPEHRRKVASILGIDAACVPDKNSLSYDRIIEGILSNQIKGLWVICTNTAHSWINQNTCREILDRLDFLVVQDMYHSTETAQLADLVLPAAGWGEKSGTFINSERRIGLLKKVARAPGQALADFSIFRLIAEAWGCGQMFARWKQPEDVFQTMKELSRDQPCDITGIVDYRFIDERGGVQWPYPSAGADDAQQRRLFSDGAFFHADRRARFIFELPRSIPEAPSPQYPYLLLTGRGTASQWHTQTRTAKSAVLKRLYPAEPYVEINPDDARRERIRPNQQVIVESQRGRVEARALVTPTVQRGQLFMPMHYEVTNQLTFAHFDPYSRQPSYKDCAVRIQPLGVERY